MRAGSMGRALVGMLIVAGVAAPLPAQDAPTRLTMSVKPRGSTVIGVSTDRPAHVTVFAVGRGPGGNPIQLLASDAPVAGRTAGQNTGVVAKALSGSDWSRFEPTAQVLVVAIASETAPNLERFVTNDRWATDVVVPDSALVDGERLIASIASTLFADGAPYVGRALPTELETLGLRNFAAVARQFDTYACPLSTQQAFLFARIEVPTLTIAEVRRAMSALLDAGDIVSTGFREMNLAEPFLNQNEDRYLRRGAPLNSCAF